MKNLRMFLDAAGCPVLGEEDTELSSDYNLTIKNESRLDGDRLIFTNGTRSTSFKRDEIKLLDVNLFTALAKKYLDRKNLV